ncbi:S-adenosyl-L-methionine-dependent methyltransferase [Lindgomyces ingoldianus]|uniref:S-adenosyl-L-methionine-dependent methyltransferase n=1 Tax=Lindgomyces ingoldianus TaxID=673940 RepID=A0ACB6QG73_9PLEO|nr:S-adenosyl-L-methionine-dependent methyltransferase [Lindgomyces ingoldianus]KAF2465357.1 S-adenosyl-L-methionine-dependent methyltransferase [Lindgomyces ingoldianus]
MAASPQSNKPSAEFIDKLTNTGWNDPGIVEKYKRAEEASKPFADVMIKKAGLESFEGEVNAFDLACGTGAVAAALYDRIPKDKWGSVKMLGGDKSELMVGYLNDRAKKQGWIGLEGRVIDGANMSLPPSTFTHFFINFGVFIMPLSTLTQCHSFLRPGGFMGLTTWAYLPWYPLVVRAINSLPSPPHCPSETEVEKQVYTSGEWQNPSFVKRTLADSGFVDVDVVQEKRKVNCGTAQDFCETMFMPLKLMSGFWAQEGEEREKMLQSVTKELESCIVQDVGEGGHIIMEFEAIIATGRKRE